LAALVVGCIGAATSVGGPGALAQEIPMEALLGRVQDNYRGQSMSARFEQLQETRPGMAPKVGTGSWRMGAPGKLRVEYDGTGRVLVTDGEKLYWYLPAEKQVHVRSQDEFAQRGNALLYLSGQGDLREDFAVSGTEWRTKLAPGNIQLRLDSLVDDTNFSHLMLEVEPDAAIIVRLVIFGVFGEANEFRFTDIERDTDLADELFRFTIPPGVEVENLGH
jgi:outer membrane lipoprotein carrier protein